MQSGKFDHANRLFVSIPNAWRYGKTHPNNYRELIPEFYFQWCFLINENGFDLGEGRDGRVDDVELPGWATSPADFCYKMRKALECDLVSHALHNWIDLMWGYKQRGQAAVEASNTFRPDMYDSVWGTAPANDPHHRAAIEATLCHVGQIPPQLFSVPHPVRNRSKIETVAKKRMSVMVMKIGVTAGFISVSKTGIIATAAVLTAVLRRSLAFFNDGPRVERLSDCEMGNQIREIPGDNCALLGSGAVIGSRRVLDHVSKFAFDRDYWVAVADDSSVRLGPDLDFNIPFYGDVVECCAISRSFKLVVCGTMTKRIVLIKLFEGEKVCVVNMDVKPEMVLITDVWGFIVVYAKDENGQPLVVVYDVNGRLMRRAEIPGEIKCWAAWTSRDAFDFLVWVAKDGKVYVTEVFYCEMKESIDRVRGAIACGYYEMGRVIVVLTEDGQLVCLPAPSWL
jgi:hypothetical protein